MAQFDPNNLDTNVVNLAKAIREHETGNQAVAGKTGELASRYQYMPATWKSTAKKYLGDENAPLTAKNEDQATYMKIKDWKDAGYTPKQIASMWNSGNPDPYAKGDKGVGKSSNNPNITYNVPKYVDNVYSKFEKISQENKPSTFQPRLAPTPQPKQPGLLSQIGSALIKPYQNISETIGGALGLGTSDYQEAQKSQQDLGDMNLKLIQAIRQNKAQGKDTSRLEEQLAQNGQTGNLAEEVAPTATTITGGELAGSIGQVGLDMLTAGTYGAAAKTAKTGVLSKLPSLAKATIPSVTSLLKPTLKSVAKGAGIGYGYDVTSNLMNKEENPLTPGLGTVLGGAIPIASGVGKLKKPIESTAKYGISQASGLGRGTIDTAINRGSELKQAMTSGLDRGQVAGEVKGAIDNRLKNLSNLGKEYQPIRESKTVANLGDRNIVKEVLSNHGIGLSDEGKLIITAESKPLKQGDVTAIEKFYEQYGKEKSLSANAFLNAREDLASNFARYDSTASGFSKTFGKEARAKYNEVLRPQFQGLKELDSAMAPEISGLKQIKKDYLNKDGSFKDNAISKIANLTNAGRESVLARLEAIIPGITEKITLLKAIEDIAKASENKAGTYLRPFIGLGGGFAAGGVPGAVIGAVMTNPKVAIELLMAYGRIKGTAKLAIQSAIGKLKLGKELNQIEKNVVEKAVNEAQTNPAFLLEAPKGQMSKYPQPLITPLPESQMKPREINSSIKKSLPPKPKGEILKSSLEVEAFKYKSADEFIKAQSLYHGTPNELEGGVLKFGAGKQLKKGGYMGGHFLTDTPEIAENFSFGGKVYQASGEIKTKVLDVNKNKKLFQDYIGKEYLSDGEKIKFTKQEFDYMFPEGKADWATVNTNLVEQLAKKQGKIGVAIPEYAGGKQGMTYQIFEDNIPVYTKSQLTDIWNKAQEVK